MDNRKEFRFPSSDGVTQIHAVEWPCEGAQRGVVQLAHGVAEYALRYDDFARFLASHGLTVVANDHIGHGESLAPGAQPLYFGAQRGWEHVVDDMQALCRLTKEKYPGKPYVLLGHSMGSFLARTLLIRYPEAVDAAIIMGTGQQSPAVLLGGRLFAGVEGRRIGFDAFSEKVDALAFGAYNKPFAPNRTPCDWLSVNEENVDRYIADPLCGGKATVGLFRDMLGGIAFIEDKRNLAEMNLNLPVLFISGDSDPVGDMGRGVKAACQSFRRAGMRDVELKLYDGLRHEILNEKCRGQVYEDILRWIDAHI